MKRNDKTSSPGRKLTLNKATIRELRPVDLERGAGGRAYEDEKSNYDACAGSDGCEC